MAAISLAHSNSDTAQPRSAHAAAARLSQSHFAQRPVPGSCARSHCDTKACMPRDEAKHESARRQRQARSSRARPSKAMPTCKPLSPGGHVMAQSGVSGWGQYASGGQMRLLVTVGEQHTQRWAAVPTAQDRGYDVVSTSPYGLPDPKDMHHARSPQHCMTRSRRR